MISRQRKASKATRKRILLILIFCIVASGLFFIYGPYPGFRIFWITTAMHTSDHQFLARMLYRPNTINAVLQNNRVVSLLDRTQASGFTSTHDETIELIRWSSQGCSAYIIRVNDPSRVTVCSAQSEQGLLLEEICALYQVKAAINASAYLTNRSKGVALGFVMSDGVIVNQGLDQKHSIIGINRHNQLILGIYYDWEIELLNLRDAVEYGPFLIINGQKAAILGNGGGIAPRTAIGQTAEGHILMLVIDGRNIKTMGATIQDVQDILWQCGAINAACLDGGASVSMYLDGALINEVNGKPDNRLLPNAFVVR